MGFKTKLALVNIIEDKNVYPFNLAYIATYLKEYLNFKNTRIIDINCEDPLTEIVNHNPNLIGISSLTIKYNDAINLAREIKKNYGCPYLDRGSSYFYLHNLHVKIF